MAPTKPYDVATQAQALTLLSTGLSCAKVGEKTGLNASTVLRISKRAQERGYTPENDPIIYISYVEDAPRVGAPRKCTKELEDEVIKAISKNSTTRELSTATIASQLSPLIRGGISSRTVHRILKRRGYKPCKPTRKPGLTSKNKLARLTWCLDHANWTLEDWKNVIWSDETSVTWGGQRGRIRVWRQVSEAYHKHCIRRRWKGFKQFMFWGCFSYYKKGPCHIWTDETQKEKTEAKAWLEEANKKIEESCKEAWELNTAMRRLNVRRRVGGVKPKWIWNEANGKLVRRASKGGIDWYRYYKEILQKKLLPFAKRCQASRPGTIVQEDNAAPHAHKHQGSVYKLWDIMRLLWPANSPDLNMIEPCWFWMKRQTTRNGVASSQKQLEQDWLDCWKKLPQKKIQEWIERIPEHIKRIIKLEGGNEYKEGLGRDGQKRRMRNAERVRA